MKTFFLFFLFLLNVTAFAQDTALYKADSTPAVTINTSNTLHTNYRARQKIVGYGSVAGYGALLAALNKAWYANYPRSAFHFYNDNGEWNQMDKTGHAWTAYQLTRSAYSVWKWAGVTDKKALLYAGLSGPGFMTVIEILDGFSKEWGFSAGDMAANIFGSGLFLGQQALWKQQKITFKFSFHGNHYQDPLLEARAGSLFGKAWYERMLKDYNAQTYWLSVNIKSFAPQSRMPAWLNIAAGYGADGMYGGYKNEWADKNNISYNRNDIPRTRQFYLAPDVDLTKIKTNKKGIRTALYMLNCLKFPTPAIMLDNKGKFKASLLYF